MHLVKCYLINRLINLCIQPSYRICLSFCHSKWGHLFISAIIKTFYIGTIWLFYLLGFNQFLKFNPGIMCANSNSHHVTRPYTYFICKLCFLFSFTWFYELLMKCSSIIIRGVCLRLLIPACPFRLTVAYQWFLLKRGMLNYFSVVQFKWLSLLSNQHCYFLSVNSVRPASHLFIRLPVFALGKNIILLLWLIYSHQTYLASTW